jgi:hypothetical protein
VTDILTTRALNRATLARQMLLKREKTTVLRAVERLAGLQAQLARPPFIGLWSRLERFRAEDLTRSVHARKIVRATLMRGTLHLVTTKDYRALRPLFQPMLTASLQAILGERARGLDLDRLTAMARVCLDERPQTLEELRSALRGAWPKADERAMGYAVRMHLPLVQVPAETRWGWPGAPAPRACATPKRGRTCGASPMCSKRSARSCACSGTSADGSCSTCRERPDRPQTPHAGALPTRLRQPAAASSSPTPGRRRCASGSIAR